MKSQSQVLSLLFLVALSYSCQTESPTEELDGTKPVKKLSYYTEFFFNPTFGFQPQTKVRYEYTITGKLSKYFVYGYDQNKSLTELHYYKFTYKNNQVDKITGYFTGDNTHPFVQYSYEYAPDLYVTKIKNENYQVGTNSEVNLNYNFTSNTVIATYTFSNGRSFSYNYELVNKNISEDAITNGSELCSIGVYSYDNGVNPLSQLGYIDYNLNNVSVNNKLTESVNYINCSFPSLVPESYTHVYDNMGYPIESTTYYKSGGISKKVFIYK